MFDLFPQIQFSQLLLLEAGHEEQEEQLLVLWAVRFHHVLGPGRREPSLRAEPRWRAHLEGGAPPHRSPGGRGPPPLEAAHLEAGPATTHLSPGGRARHSINAAAHLEGGAPDKPRSTWRAVSAHLEGGAAHLEGGAPPHRSPGGRGRSLGGRGPATPLTWRAGPRHTAHLEGGAAHLEGGAPPHRSPGGRGPDTPLTWRAGPRHTAHLEGNS
ncbi:unnamed protein product [Arctogadus glacialis]